MVNRQECDCKTDEELVQLALSDQDWFLCLVQRYEEKLGRYIRRIAGLNQQDIEDVLQEVFIKVYQNLNGFDTDLKFSSWIYRICHNTVISHFRKTQARPDMILGEEGEKILFGIPDKGNLADEVHNRLSGEQINKILQKMDVKYREVLVLKFLEDKDYNDISDILKKPIGTVGTLINRAKKQFKEQADQLGIKFE
ncbi:MAG: RNA polymerase sigma factor [Patescibacteria group bacterium]